MLDVTTDMIESLTKGIRRYEREIECVLEDAYPEEGQRLRQSFGVGPEPDTELEMIGTPVAA